MFTERHLQYIFNDIVTSRLTAICHYS